MKITNASVKLSPFDAAEYLTDDAAIAEYMQAVLELDDSDLILLALGDIARARGMAKLAKDSGLGRESLYKALAPGAKPRFDTVMKVIRALGLKLNAQTVQERAPVRKSRRPGSAKGEIWMAPEFADTPSDFKDYT